MNIRKMLICFWEGYLRPFLVRLRLLKPRLWYDGTSFLFVHPDCSKQWDEPAWTTNDGRYMGLDVKQVREDTTEVEEKS